jgi:hypothetical protein
MFKTGNEPIDGWIGGVRLPWILVLLTFEELKGRNTGNTGAEFKAKKSLLAQSKSKGCSERQAAGHGNW